MPRKSKKPTTKALQPARDINRAQRITLATKMRIEGHEWETIAAVCGIRGGKGAAYNLVNEALKIERREATEELRTLEALRLNALLAVYYPKALEGDGWSLDRVLRIMERRAQLLGLDAQAAQENAPTVIQRIYPPSWMEGAA